MNHIYDAIEIKMGAEGNVSHFPQSGHGAVMISCRVCGTVINYVPGKSRLLIKGDPF